MNSFQKQSRFLNPTKVPFLENLFERFHQKVGKLKNHEKEIFPMSPEVIQHFDKENQ